MTKQRPKNLDLNTIKLPIMGVASILHRISAVIIWVSMFLLLPALFFSLHSAEEFEQVKNLLIDTFIGKFIAWGFLTALSYYIVGGLKHIIQEFGYFETLEGGALISKIAIGLGGLLSILFGFWIWS